MQQIETNRLKYSASGISFLSGVYIGYCNAQNIPIDPTVELALTYGPAVLKGSIEAVIDGKEFYYDTKEKLNHLGVRDISIESVDQTPRLGAKTKRVLELGTAVATISGGIKGTTKGGLFTILGIATGSAIGHLFK